MNTYRILAAFMFVVTLNACGTTPTPTPPALIPNTGSATIGTVNTMQNNVQAGPIGNLSNVPVSQTLYDDDAVRVIDGGAALLNFFDQIALRLFNDSSIDGVNVEILESTNRRIRMKLERGGLSGEVAKDSGGADFEIANGIHIYILGTSFYITYDPATNIVSTGNFDGTVGYQVPGQSPQLLPAGSLIDILPGGVVQLFNMPFDINAFDAAAQTGGSPIEGLRALRATSITNIDTPAPAPISTIIPTQRPTPCPILAGWQPIIVQPVDTLDTIAARYGTTTGMLIQGNCLSAPNLGAGTVIYAPPLLAVTPCFHPAGWITYIVQSGDNLYQIGLRYGVTAATLQSGNCMGYSYQIYTGQTLYVPNVATSTPSIQPIPNTLTPPIPYSISGNVGTAGTTLSYTDGTFKTATADGNGNYSFTVSNNWSGTVTPSKTGYIFSPVSKSYSNVIVNQTAQNYAAIPIITYVISGNVRVAGTTLSYTDGTVKTATADGNGNYSFTVSNNWSGTVTPSKTGYIFSPVSKSYSSVLANQTAQNYSATGIANTISGNVGTAGATLNYTDGTFKTATADGNGNYSFTVSNNWSGTVTPSKTGYIFSPVNKSYSNVIVNQTAQNYSATAITYTISGNAGVGYAILSYTDGAAKTATADAQGNYSFTVSYSWFGTVTPYQIDYTFSPVSIDYFNVLANQTRQNYMATLKTYALTVSKSGIGSGIVISSPTGINCGSTCTYNFDYNTSVTLTATATYGFFNSWSGACTGTGTCTLTMDADKSVTADFYVSIGLFEPDHPFGAKAVAVGNAILDAIGVNVDDNPVTPEKTWRAIKNR